MKKKNFLICLLAIIVILSVISFTALTGCRGARLEKLKNLKESQESSEEKASSVKEAGDTDETLSIQTGDLKEEAKETGGGQEAEDDNSEQLQDEEQEVESTEPEAPEEETEETVESLEETVEESAEETVQLTKEFVNIDMEGGSITRDMFATAGIHCGDYPNSVEEHRGFASFDISGIAGAKILEASIKAVGGRKDGQPFEKYGPVIIKSVYWGPNKISPLNFNIEGIELANFTVRNFTISNNILKDNLQDAVNNGLARYQICLYFEMESADGDAAQDLIHHNTDEISLTVTYSIAGQ